MSRTTVTLFARSNFAHRASYIVARCHFLACVRLIFTVSFHCLYAETGHPWLLLLSNKLWDHAWSSHHTLWGHVSSPCILIITVGTDWACMVGLFCIVWIFSAHTSSTCLVVCWAVHVSLSCCLMQACWAILSGILNVVFWSKDVPEYYSRWLPHCYSWLLDSQGGVCLSLT